MFSSWLCRSSLSFACLGAILASGCQDGPPPDPRFEDPARQRPNDSKKLTVVFVDGVPVPAESASEAIAAMGNRKPPASKRPAVRTQVHWKVPASWTPVDPSSQVRLAEYRVPSPQPDGAHAEVAVFYLGPSANVPPDETLQRWASSFDTASAKAAKRTMRSVGAYSAHLLEVSGTHQESSMMAREGESEGVVRPDWMLLGAIVVTPAGPYYFKLLGPKEVVGGARHDFMTMIDSIGDAGAPPPPSASTTTEVSAASSAPKPPSSASPSSR